nr:glycosyltransferase family 2 protein [Pelotalea chapellei]
MVNWNAASQLSEAVSSIAQYHNGLISSVIIIDNNSSDDSLALVEALGVLPFRLQIIRNAENCGFGAACNQGAALGNAEYLLFLNPDTLLHENSLVVPLNFMQEPENADVGLVGIQLVDELNHIARSCARFPSLGTFVAHTLGFNRIPIFGHLNMHMEDWAHDTTATVDHVIGAFYLIRRSVFESLRGFDDRFFVYLEDLDLSFRIHQAGFRCVFLADAQAFHAGGGTSHQVKARRLFYSLRSRLLYGFKHFKSWQAWILLAISLGLEPLSRVGFALLRGSRGDVLNTFNAYRMLYCDLPNTLKRALRS